MKTLLAVVCAIPFLVACGGAGGPHASADPLPPYPGDPVAHQPPPPGHIDPADPAVPVGATFSTPNGRFGIWNQTGVAMKWIGYSREGEYLGIVLGSLADHGDFSIVPMDGAILPGSVYETPGQVIQPLPKPHGVFCVDWNDVRYEARMLTVPGSMGWIVRPEDAVATP